MNAPREDDFSADSLQEGGVPESGLPQIPEAFLVRSELEGELKRGVGSQVDEDLRVLLDQMLKDVQDHLNALFPEPESPRLPYPERVSHQTELLQELDALEDLLEALLLLGQ